MRETYEEPALSQESNRHIRIRRWVFEPVYLMMVRNRALFWGMSTKGTVADLKNRLSEYLTMVENGNEVIAWHRNVSLTRINLIESRSKTKPQGLCC